MEEARRVLQQLTDKLEKVTAAERPTKKRKQEEDTTLVSLINVFSCMIPMPAVMIAAKP